MKKTIGWILVVIVLLNFVSIMARASKNEPLGSPMYFILLVMMFFGGLYMIDYKKAPADDTSTDVVKKDEN